MTPQNDTPLKVGYILKRYPRFSETFVVHEILAHERAGMNIVIFALGDVSETHFQGIISQVKAPVYRLQDKQRIPEKLWALLRKAREELPGFNQNLELLHHPNVHEFAQAILLAFEIQKHKITHLHAHFATRATTVARLAAKLCNITYTFTAHAKDIYYPYEDDTRLDIKIGDAAKAITISDYNLAYLQDKFSAVKNNIVRIYNGMDLNAFYFSAQKEFSATTPTILAVGRLVEKKGFPVLIDSLAIVRNQGLSFHCILAGDGPLRTILEEKIDEHKLHSHITLTGPLAQKSIVEAIRSSSMLVAPCIISQDGDRDGIPTVLLEAMACGTPVISTNVAGIPELVINAETGLCIEPNDPQALAEAIIHLLTNPELSRRVANNARKLIENNYDIESNTALLRNLFIAATTTNTVAEKGE